MPNPSEIVGARLHSMVGDAPPRYALERLILDITKHASTDRAENEMKCRECTFLTARSFLTAIPFSSSHCVPRIDIARTPVWAEATFGSRKHDSLIVMGGK